MSSAESFDAAIESLLMIYAADVVCYPAEGWVEEEACHGHEGIRRLAAVWREQADDVTMQIHDVRDLKQRILVLAEFSGRDRASGEPVTVLFGVLNSDLRADGKVGEARFFLGWDAALEFVASEP
jgi:hypothetical protein